MHFNVLDIFLGELRYKYRFESLEKNLNIHAKEVVTENSFVRIRYEEPLAGENILFNRAIISASEVPRIQNDESG